MVHYEIEKNKYKFALSGSSSRKIKQGGANLLAGRAFVNHMYPLSYQELGSDFNLLEILRWGSLPSLYSLLSVLEKEEYLKSYVQTYLKEEIFQEQLVRKTVPFRKFLPLAAQTNGKIINHNKMAKNLGIDWSTLKTYYDILEDTYLGFSLPAFSKSLRKQQLKSSKFYLFDNGVSRTLNGEIKLPLVSSQQIRPLFENFLINEIFKLNKYFGKDYRLSYLATQGGLEVDLILERPGLSTVLIEIKSSKNVDYDKLSHLKTLKKEFSEYEAIVLSQDSLAREKEGVTIYPWREGLGYLGFGTR